MKRLYGALVMLAVFAGLAGCGRSDLDLAGVTGTVTLDGKALPDAFIVFTPTSEGTTSYGRTDETGQYEMMFSDDAMGAWLGENRIEISTGDVGAAEEGGSRERVPVEYNRRSTLVRDVKSGANVFDFELESDAGRVVETTVE